MGAFVLTYSIVWLAMVLYVVRLEFDQRRLTRAAEILQSPLARHDKERSELTGDPAR